MYYIHHGNTGLTVGMGDVRGRANCTDGSGRRAHQRLTDKIDTVKDRIDEMDRRLNGKTDSLKDSVTNLTLAAEKSFTDLKVNRWVDRGM